MLSALPQRATQSACDKQQHSTLLGQAISHRCATKQGKQSHPGPSCSRLLQHHVPLFQTLKSVGNTDVHVPGRLQDPSRAPEAYSSNSTNVWFDCKPKLRGEQLQTSTAALLARNPSLNNHTNVSTTAGISAAIAYVIPTAMLSTVMMMACNGSTVCWYLGRHRWRTCKPSSWLSRRRLTREAKAFALSSSFDGPQQRNQANFTTVIMMHIAAVGSAAVATECDLRLIQRHINERFDSVLQCVTVALLPP